MDLYTFKNFIDKTLNFFTKKINKGKSGIHDIGSYLQKVFVILFTLAVTYGICIPSKYIKQFYSSCALKKDIKAYSLYKVKRNV